MQLNFESNKRDLTNNANNGFGGFINEFLKELSNYLENFIQNKNITYCVMSDVDKNGQVYLVAQNGSGAGQNLKIDDLPIGTKRGTILRNRNGKFVIDENLSKKSLDDLNKLNETNQRLQAEYKTENVDYLVTELGDDYVMLKNQQTGLEFDSTDFSKEVFDSLYEGLMLTCKNGEYVVT